MSGTRLEDDPPRKVISIPEPPRAASGKISELFHALKSRVGGFRPLFAARDEAAAREKTASKNFADEPNLRNFEALLSARRSLVELAAVLPDDEQELVADATSRIFDAPEAWQALAGALDSRADKCRKREQMARVAFSEAVRNYLSETPGAFEISIVSLDQARPLAARLCATRSALEMMIAEKDEATQKANLCRYIAGGQMPTEGQSFQEVAKVLDNAFSDFA